MVSALIPADSVNQNASSCNHENTNKNITESFGADPFDPVKDREAVWPEGKEFLETRRQF
jgi:hypothetical protein